MNLNRKQLIALEDIDETSTKPEHTQAVGERETKESFWPLNRLDNLSVYIYAGGNDCGIGYVELSSKRLSTLNFQKKRPKSNVEIGALQRIHTVQIQIDTE